MAPSAQDTRLVLKRLADKAFQSSQERDQLLAQLAAATELKGRDLAWMLFRPDRAYRDAALPILQRLADPETVDAVIGESRGKPEAAVRAAAAALFAIQLPGSERRLAEIAIQAKGEPQEIARRLLLDAPVTPALEPVLWQLASSGRLEERQAFLARLAAQRPDPKSLPRWQRLARDPEKQLRDKALAVLAQHDPAGSVDLFVEQLPLADYSTQQLLVEALRRAAASQGAAFADRLLPLIAAGEAGTRSVVLKILLGMQDRRGVVRRYIVFSKSLAGWARDRALESMRAFENDLIEPTIELLSDPDDEVRGAAMQVAQSFEDPRIVPATIELLKDRDWWIRISAAETLGRLKDPRGVQPLIDALADPETRWSAVEALGRIGDLRAAPALSQLLQDPAPEVRIEVLQALSHFQHPQMLDFVRGVAKSDPSRAVRARAFEITTEMAARQHQKLSDEDALKHAALAAKSGANEPKLNALLVATRNNGASDFHLSVGQPPVIRLAADLVRAQGEPFTAEQTEAMVREILTDAQWQRFQDERQLDFCYYLPTAGRYRANVFVDQKGVNAVFRVIPERPPTIAEIGLPAHLAEIAEYHQGLVIVCGPSGSGKSTTLAALVNLFNETRHDHVITMEDPVEFVHPFKSCLVNQREVGSDTRSFARALRAALREDPDVVVIGELRDTESVSLALTAAETGHIVLGTLNSTSAHKAVDRILASFPADEQGQVRAALSESLKFVVAQRLLPAKEARKQVAAFEVLRNTVAVANMIREEKTFQIPSAMQIGKSLGMQTFDDALKQLVAAGRITGETAYRAAAKKEEFEALLPGGAPDARGPSAAPEPKRP
jgi:twitching motility protein PilT